VRANGVEPIEIGLDFVQGHSERKGRANGLRPLQKGSRVLQEPFRDFMGHPRAPSLNPDDELWRARLRAERLIEAGNLAWRPDPAPAEFYCLEPRKASVFR
jgi:hypothetical protein